MYAPDKNTRINAQGLATPSDERVVRGHPGPELHGVNYAVLRAAIARPVTRLKMKVTHVSEPSQGDNPLINIGLSAVSIADEPVFGKYTPNGNLNFSVIPEAAVNLKAGQTVYVDLVPAGDE